MIETRSTYLTALITALWASDETFATYRSTSISAGDFITRLKKKNYLVVDSVNNLMNLMNRSFDLFIFSGNEYQNQEKSVWLPVNETFFFRAADNR